MVQSIFMSLVKGMVGLERTGLEREPPSPSFLHDSYPSHPSSQHSSLHQMRYRTVSIFNTLQRSLVVTVDVMTLFTVS
ncbi:hypothetical protein HMI54_015507 [Coelomomyces lativittatus]|nr:hypothetical protein HMI54_015507 [Coelomomyces lativittatus]